MAEASSTEEVVTLRIRWKSETLESFAERYASSIGPTEFFVRTRQPLAPGTHLAFDFTLNDGSPLLAGRGTVAWVRPPSHAGNDAPGMGIRFDYLPPESRQRLARVLAWRDSKGAGHPAPGKGASAGVAARESQSLSGLAPPRAPSAAGPAGGGPGYVSPGKSAAGFGAPARPGKGGVAAPRPTLADLPRAGAPAEDFEKTEVARFPPGFGPEAEARGDQDPGASASAAQSELEDDLTSPRAEPPVARPASVASIPWQAPRAPQAGSLGAALRPPIPTATKTTPADELLAVTAVQDRPSLTGLLAGENPERDDARESAGRRIRTPAPQKAPPRGSAAASDLATGPTALISLPTRQPSPPAVAAPAAPSGPIGGTMELPRGPGSFGAALPPSSGGTAELDDADFSAVDEPPVHMSALPAVPSAPAAASAPPRTRALPRVNPPLGTSEIEASAWPSPMAPPPSRRRSGTGRTWLLTTLGAGLLVIGGLWLLPRFLGTEPNAARDLLGVGEPDTSPEPGARAQDPMIGADTPEGATDPAAVGGSEAAEPIEAVAEGKKAEAPAPEAPAAGGGLVEEAKKPPKDPAAEPGAAAAVAAGSESGGADDGAEASASEPRKRRPRRRRPPVVVTGEEIASPAAEGPGGLAAAPGAAAVPPVPEAPVATNGAEVYWLNVHSRPEGAEVSVDGQVEGKTPFQRRILDPSRAYRVTVRTPGYEAVERTVTSNDQWRRKGNVRTLTVTARLRRASAGTSVVDPFAGGDPGASAPAAGSVPPVEQPSALEPPAGTGAPPGAAPPANTSPPPAQPPVEPPPAPKENPFEAAPAPAP